ncbi:unnamed protein product [Cyprideis torosa]|uniref:Uncharacterized protein n=1 Tax=Cyprideis torosa TaxID=163714 RepID=A0A7R8ZGS3_9CRUS|nr:unnamed protein product [Cyprideis torosa]CAG0880912.1 unnamed protein product [Cyprideis torosa]
MASQKQNESKKKRRGKEKESSLTKKEEELLGQTEKEGSTSGTVARSLDSSELLAPSETSSGFTGKASEAGSSLIRGISLVDIHREKMDCGDSGTIVGEGSGSASARDDDAMSTMSSRSRKQKRNARKRIKDKMDRQEAAAATKETAQATLRAEDGRSRSTSERPAANRGDDGGPWTEVRGRSRRGQPPNRQHQRQRQWKQEARRRSEANQRRLEEKRGRGRGGFRGRGFHAPPSDAKREGAPVKGDRHQAPPSSRRLESAGGVSGQRQSPPPQGSSEGAPAPPAFKRPEGGARHSMEPPPPRRSEGSKGKEPLQTPAATCAASTSAAPGTSKRGREEGGTPEEARVPKKKSRTNLFKLQLPRVLHQHQQHLEHPNVVEKKGAPLRRPVSRRRRAARWLRRHESSLL